MTPTENRCSLNTLSTSERTKYLIFDCDYGAFFYVFDIVRQTLTKYTVEGKYASEFPIFDFHPDQTYMAVGSSTYVSIFDDNLKRVASFYADILHGGCCLGERVYAKFIHYSATGHYLAFLTARNFFDVFDTLSHKKTDGFPIDDCTCEHIAWANQTDKLAFIDDNRLTVVDFASGQRYIQDNLEPQAIFTFQISPDNHSIAYANSDGLSVRDIKNLAKKTDWNFWPTTIKWGPNNNLLLLQNHSEQKIINLSNHLKYYQSNVYRTYYKYPSIATTDWSGDLQSVIFGNPHATFSYFLADKTEKTWFETFETIDNSSISPNKQMIAIIVNDKLFIFDFEINSFVMYIDTHPAYSFGKFYWSPNSQFVVFEHYLLDLKSKSYRELDQHFTPLISFEKDGDSYLAGKYQGQETDSVVVINISRGNDHFAYQWNTGKIGSLAISPDNTIFTIGAETGDLLFFDVTHDFQPVGKIETNFQTIKSIQWTTDLQSFVVSADGQLHIWQQKR